MAGRRQRRIAAGLLAVLVATPAAAAGLVPHEARFALTLGAIHGQESVASSGGEMIFRIERACDTWTVLNRMSFEVLLDETQGMRIDTASGMQESADGRTLSFEHQTSVNGQLTEALRGTAALGEPGEPGRAIYTLPERREIALPPDTVLPVAATEATLAAFAGGEKMRSYRQFDGQHPQGPTRIGEIVTGTPQPLAKPPHGDTDLLDMPAWRITTSFFGGDPANIEPVGTQMGDMQANGVLRWLRLHLDTMTVDADLVEITALPAKPC